MRIVVVRASDVPTYVQYGAAELGVAGKDVLLEHGAHWGDRGLYQPVDLGIARCRLCVAVPVGFDYANAVGVVLVCASPPNTCKPRASTSRRRVCTSI